jgi:hypothetical protein
MSKLIYFCDCGIGDTKPKNQPHPTTINKDETCVYCGYYAHSKHATSKIYAIIADKEDMKSPIGEDYHSHIDVETLEFSDT